MRADQALVAHGLARSRAIARELIDAGRVRTGDKVVAKSSLDVRPESLTVDGEQDPWVGRAAYKLVAALQQFSAIEVRGRTCIDVGASTGGFTQVLLHHGAVRVVAIDVGRDQLAPMLRDDPRVDERSGVNIRDVVAKQAPSERSEIAPAPVVVSDLSFISLQLVLDHLATLTEPAGHLIALIKPQFEVGRERLARTGIVRSGHERRRAVEAVLTRAAVVGMHVWGLADSPIEGTNGNHEFLLWARHEAVGAMSQDEVVQFLRHVETSAAR